MQQIAAFPSCAALATAAFAVAASNLAQAHHSSATYDVGKTYVLTGVVNRIDANPEHLRLFVAPLDEARAGVLRDKSGEPVIWTIEMDGAAGAARHGITANAFPRGAVVSVGLHPLRNGLSGGTRADSGLFKCPPDRMPEPGAHCDAVPGSTLHGDSSLPDATDALPGNYAGQAGAPAERSRAAGAKGDQLRHYRFVEAGRDMAYRLYVPAEYDADEAAPLVVALHGYGGDQDYFFDAVEELADLCERYGFVFVAPMGLASDGWYGAPLSIPGDAPRSSGEPTPAPARTAAEETRYRALSETDVLNVLEIVSGEYNIDPDRIYLMGHSMGGFGTWWLGQKHARLWAAIAPMSGVLPNVDYRLANLEQVAVHVSIGGAENPDWVAASRRQVETMKAMGMRAEYFEPEGASHGSMIAPTVPRVFEFLSRQRRGGGRLD